MTIQNKNKPTLTINSHPFLSSLIGNSWSIKDDYFSQFMNAVNKLDPALALNPIEVNTQSKMRIKDNTAFIPVNGVLMQSVPWWMNFLGMSATSYTAIIDDLITAINNDSITDIILEVDSPGGSVSGSMEAANAISEAAKIKNVTAHVYNLAASGSYLLASQADKIYANKNALIGCMGVYRVVYDESRIAENEGWIVNVIKSGDIKGAGTPGSRLQDTQIKAMQNEVDDLANVYLETVSQGRNMSLDDLKLLATGDVWIADKALGKGLIDGILTEKQITIKETNEMSNLKNQTDVEAEPDVVETPGEKTIEEDETEVKSKEVEQTEASSTDDSMARLEELEEAFPTDSAFVLAQFKKGNNVAQAKAEAYDLLKTKQTKTNSEKPNDAEPLPQGNTDNAGGNDFISMAKALSEEKGISMKQAMSQIARENPSLYRR